MDGKKLVIAIIAIYPVIFLSAFLLCNRPRQIIYNTTYEVTFVKGNDVGLEEIQKVPSKEKEELNKMVVYEEELYSPEDIDLLARVVMSEASTQSNDCKQAVAAVVLNRVNSDKYPDTVSEAVYAPNQFSTANNGEPTAECYEAVYKAIRSPEAYPRDMYWFRSDHYHTYGNKLFNDGEMYFSTE